MPKLHWQILAKLKLAGWALAGSPHSYLRTSGWFRSVNTRQSVDQQGNPLPWLTYPAIHFLETRNLSNLHVFEYGCGNSTLWFAHRVSSIQSVEHNPVWARHVAELVPPNASVQLVTVGYPESITAYGVRFDLIIVDGILRNECLVQATACLAPSGVILLDNSDREEYSQGIAHLQQLGFRRLDFAGLCGISNIGSCTSFFYKPDNCLGI